MKRMVDALVYEVRSETTRANISCGKYSKQEVKIKKVTGIATEVCPKCKRDPNSKSAYGCSNYKAGCDFVLPYTQKKISENQYIRLLQKDLQ
jgi:DNA topoisomerase-3